MASVKIVTWNAEWMTRMFESNSDKLLSSHVKGRVNIPDVNAWANKKAQYIKQLDPDILGIQEGPILTSQMKKFVSTYLQDTTGGSMYDVVRAPNGPKFGSYMDRQYVYLLIKKEQNFQVTSLSTNSLVKKTMYKKWPVNYWGQIKSQEHEFWRRPLVADVKLKQNREIRFVITHMKSLILQKSENWYKKNKQKYIKKAMTSRIKLSTEAWKMRQYIDEVLKQDSKKALVVMGDFNDGPGRRYFEKKFLFYDMIDVLMGTLMSPEKIMTHVLAGYPADNRFTSKFKDFLNKKASPKLLLDHILVSPSMMNTGKIKLKKNSASIDHQLFESLVTGKASRHRPSDHRAVTIKIEY